jgi:hypothetical protein
MVSPSAFAVLRLIAVGMPLSNRKILTLDVAELA